MFAISGALKAPTHNESYFCEYNIFLYFISMFSFNDGSTISTIVQENVSRDNWTRVTVLTNVFGYVSGLKCHLNFSSVNLKTHWMQLTLSTVCRLRCEETTTNVHQSNAKPSQANLSEAKRNHTKPIPLTLTT